MSDNKTTRRRFLQATGGATAIALAGCSGSADDANMDSDAANTGSGGTGTMNDESMGDGETPTDSPDAMRVSIDRFSEAAGTLHVRGPDNDLPEPDEPIDFDQQFLAQGLGPDGQVVQYYDFDVQPTEPAPIYALFHENGEPVEGQRNIVDVIPGDDGYNDFWHVHKVTVPDDYEANAATSVADLTDAGYEMEATNSIKNCPIVPAGSTASKRHGECNTALIEGWYDGKVVNYFVFEEAPLEPTSGGSVPLSPIYVSFNTNPGQEGGGPASGFMAEADSAQTHNVVATLPGDAGYSPLWLVNIYDNADFDSVSDLESAMNANILASGAATVNCPVVSVAME